MAAADVDVAAVAAELAALGERVNGGFALLGAEIRNGHRVDAIHRRQQTKALTRLEESVDELAIGLDERVGTLERFKTRLLVAVAGVAATAGAGGANGLPWLARFAQHLL